MIVALILGREGSVGFPGKNTFPVLGRPLMSYPLLAARFSKNVDLAYVSTDSEKIKRIALEYGATVIDRPTELATKTALGDDAFVHGYQYIKKISSKPIELIVLLFCNGATILAKTIDEGIDILRNDLTLDSAVTVSCYNMWSPLRARKVNSQGLLEPFVPFEAFGDPEVLNCDRDSQGDVLFADMSVSIVRPHCLDSLDYGILPQRWMGQKIYPLKQWGGCDVDYPWQIPGVEFWLRENGFSETKIPYQESSHTA